MSLIELCKEGDLEGVKAALQKGADVNSRDEDGNTGLMGAVWNGHNSVVELLLKTPKNDVNQTNTWGYYALHHAIRLQNDEVLKLLLNVPSIDVNMVDNSADESPVQWAVVKPILSSLAGKY